MKQYPEAHSFSDQLREIGVNPEDVIAVLREEIVALAKEKKEEGFSYQEFQNLIHEKGFELTCYLQASV